MRTQLQPALTHPNHWKLMELDGEDIELRSEDFRASNHKDRKLVEGLLITSR